MMNDPDPLLQLAMPKRYRSGRCSSYDRSGGNVDYWPIAPGETKILADIAGPGVLSHIWFTFGSTDPHYLRKIVLHIYWDDEPSPSVSTPVGDFFGLGHAQTFTYQCEAFSTTCQTEGGMGVAMNCWLPMPFQRRARVEVVNEQEVLVHGIFFYIDYQLYDALPSDICYLHAQWRRENPCDGWQGEGSEMNSEAWNRRMETEEGRNLSDKGNYLILEAEGRGHYIGMNMSIGHLSPGWWGEGDDMIFIDRGTEDEWPPALHGTGTEDYLCHAWGMQSAAHRFSGQSWSEKGDYTKMGKVCVYRYHLQDPVAFTRNIRVSIEHGHANSRSDDFSSVAYWYQNEPHKPFPAMLPPERRIPGTGNP